MRGFLFLAAVFALGNSNGFAGTHSTDDEPTVVEATPTPGTTAVEPAIATEVKAVPQGPAEDLDSLVKGLGEDFDSMKSMRDRLETLVDRANPGTKSYETLKGALDKGFREGDLHTRGEILGLAKRLFPREIQFETSYGDDPRKVLNMRLLENDISKTKRSIDTLRENRNWVEEAKTLQAELARDRTKTIEEKLPAFEANTNKLLNGNDRVKISDGQGGLELWFGRGQVKVDQGKFDDTFEVQTRTSPSSRLPKPILDGMQQHRENLSRSQEERAFEVLTSPAEVKSTSKDGFIVKTPMLNFLQEFKAKSPDLEQLEERLRYGDYKRLELQYHTEEGKNLGSFSHPRLKP